MAGKLKRQEGTETLSFEVFDLDLDDADRQTLADNPRKFLDGLLKEEGQKVNALLMESDDKFLKPDATSAGVTPLPPTLWHCTSPPTHASKWITLVPGGTHLEDGEEPLR